jgi:hypothetical protein
VIQATMLVMVLLTAAPERLHQATRSLDDLKYQAALETLPPESAIDSWRREEVLEWFSTRALAQLGLKQEAEARQSFQRLFSLAPEWALPDQYGPRVRTFASAARAEAVRSGAISVGFEGGLLRTTRDAYGYANALEVSWREPEGSWQSATLPLEPRQPPPWPREKKLEVWGRVLGLAGSTLFEWASENAPIRLEPLAVVTVDGGTVAPSRGLGALGVIGVGAGVAGLISTGLGVGFAVSSQDAERTRAGATRDGEGRITSLSQRDAFALDRRVSGEAGAATVFVITGAALVAAGTSLVLFDRLTVTPVAGGAVLTVPLDASFAFAGVGRPR